ncbi:hypothetical protein [Microbacterium sp. K24]|uniref:hypothetical protein n=1 Tax=Microbacterium sp. K24 TaxID=2305446 RepID=UPI00109C081E|nr:hypothetical protein [Microbacterium sp. K24]
MSKKQNILNAHVARLVGGVLVTAGPGDVAPDWVTNTALFESAPEVGEPQETPLVAAASTPAPKEKPVKVTDDLSDLGIAELREIASTLELAKSGSKKEIAERIRAKRSADAAEQAPAGDEDRDALVAAATDAGIEDADELTDDELRAAIESAGE